MPQRYMCPSMGALRRPLAQRITAGSRCSRSFHSSTRRLEDKPDSSSPSTSGSENQRGPRRQRNANAAAQIGNLQSRRPPPRASSLAGGFFRSGQRAEPSNTPQNGDKPSSGPKINTPRKPLVRKDSSGAPGTMVRAPAKLRITREAGGAPGQPRGGPNLMRRSGPPGKSRGGPNNRGSESGPARRERSAGGSAGDAPRVDQDVVDPNSINESLMQTMYRMQRNMWDRKPYVPKYAPGSFEANELIHAGRELFKGESPPVKVWGKLEKTLNVVGMHGAEAHLKVRRVPDGDAMPFGKEEENMLDLLEVKQTEATEKKTTEIAA